MQRFTLDNRPAEMTTYQKIATADAVLVTEPFEVETQEGVIVVSPETVDNWDGGYYLVYPSDGSKPYTWSPAFKRQNMIPVDRNATEAVLNSEEGES